MARLFSNRRAAVRHGRAADGAARARSASRDHRRAHARRCVPSFFRIDPRRDPGVPRAVREVLRRRGGGEARAGAGRRACKSKKPEGVRILPGCHARRGLPHRRLRLVEGTAGAHARLRLPGRVRARAEGGGAGRRVDPRDQRRAHRRALRRGGGGARRLSAHPRLAGARAHRRRDAGIDRAPRTARRSREGRQRRAAGAAHAARVPPRRDHHRLRDGGRPAARVARLARCRELHGQAGNPPRLDRGRGGKAPAAHGPLRDGAHQARERADHARAARRDQAHAQARRPLLARARRRPRREARERAPPLRGQAPARLRHDPAHPQHGSDARFTRIFSQESGGGEFPVECGFDKSARLLHGRRPGRYLPRRAVDVLLARRREGRADRALPPLGGGDADRPGLRDHGGRLGRRLDLGRAVDARLYARRADGRHHGGAPAPPGLVGARALERVFRAAAHPGGADGRVGRALAHRRAGAQSLHRPALEIDRVHHRPAARGRPADRLRPAGGVRDVHEVRARMPVQRDPFRAEGHVQRLRDVEARRREVRPLSPVERQGLGLRALHEDLPLQPRGPGRVRAPAVALDRCAAIAPRADRLRRRGRRRQPAISSSDGGSISRWSAARW